MNYSEKLKDPRWQKKRLEILNRDEFKCTFCGDSETELHVHHELYFGEPWEAKIENLKTLCKDCHLITERNKEIDFSKSRVTKLLSTNKKAFVMFIIDQNNALHVVTKRLNQIEVHSVREKGTEAITKLINNG